MQSISRVVQNVLVVEVTGQIDTREAVAFGRAVLQEHARLGTTGILIDARKVQGELAPLDRYQLGVEAAALQHEFQPSDAMPPRIAIVATPPLFDSRRLLETVALNRGAILHSFQSLDEAARWMHLDPALLLEQFAVEGSDEQGSGGGPAAGHPLSK
jgi:hypothetical protein